MATKQLPVAPNGGTWLRRDKGIYKTARGNIAKMTNGYLKKEDRLSVKERLYRLELWVSKQFLRDAEGQR